MIVKPKRSRRQQALTAIAYRTPMPITELSVRWNREGYYLCPRCHATLDRDFCAYCDRCGQCLSWAGYQQAKQIYTG